MGKKSKLLSKHKKALSNKKPKSKLDKMVRRKKAVELTPPKEK